MTCREARPLLSACLDGELDLVRTLDVEAHAQECRSCAAVLENLKGLSQAVAAAPYYPAPPALRARVESSPTPVWRRPVPWLALAASVVIAAVLAGRPVPVNQVGNEIAQSYLRSLRAGHLVDVASSGGHIVRPWFAGKLDYALDVDDISGRGFELAGGRLDSLNGRTVAVLVYQRGPHVVNVFVWPANQRSDQAPTGRVIHAFNIVNWRADGMNWWAISDLSLGELEELPLCPCFMPVHETLRS